MAFDNRGQKLTKLAARSNEVIGMDDREFANWCWKQVPKATHQDITFARNNFMKYASNFRLGYYGNDMKYGY